MWHDAGGNVFGETIDVIWLRFLDCCDRVRFPKGTSPAELALERAKTNPLPSVARRFDDPSVQLLVAVCHELQRLSGSSPFFLSCRTAGELIGVPHHLANVLLRGLARDGVLREIAKGGISARGKLATRWRFVGW